MNPLHKGAAMKRTIFTFFLSLCVISGPAFPLTLSDCYGRWQNGIYTFTFNKNYTASVIIDINPRESIVFSGVFNVEKDNLIRINISEMKQCPRGTAFSKSGFSKTASSHFIFSLDPKADKRTLVVRPKTITIDGNNGEGYFEPEMVLKR
jgi:hypothetical protein